MIFKQVICITVYKINRSLLQHQNRKKFLPLDKHSSYLHEDTISELTFSRGYGSRLWDIDDNEYLDLCGKQGSQFIGHGHPEFIRIIKQSLDSVLSVNHTSVDLDVFQYLHNYVPCCEKVRFGLSGSETIQNAIRLAREYTNKRIVLRFEGHYHGTSDIILKVDNCNVYQIQWNSMQIIDDFRKCHSDIAAIIMEPLCMSSGGLAVDTSYLKELRNFCSQYNIVLIFDEVITGVRTGLGGLQLKYGVIPDLCVYAKGISNGVPISALMGRSDLMDLYERHKVIHGGTHNGHQLGLSAIMATFQIISNIDSDSAWLYTQRCEKLIKLFISAGEKAGLPVSVQGEQCCYALNCSENKIMDISQWDNILIKKNAILHSCLQRYGILTATVCRIYPNIMLNDNDLDFIELRCVAAFFEAKKIIDKWL